MEQVVTENFDIDFGGQNQIVNQQEQNREVNPGGLTQTDSEKTLYGSPEEAAEAAAEFTNAYPEEISESDEAHTETEEPAKNLKDTVA